MMIQFPGGGGGGGGGGVKNTYELLNLRTLKDSPVNQIHIIQCMGKIFCVEFQRYPMKFHTKYLTYRLKSSYASLKTLTLRQDGCHIADNICKSIFINENI